MSLQGMDGVKCFSIYPSKMQTDPEDVYSVSRSRKLFFLHQKMAPNGWVLKYLDGELCQLNSQCIYVLQAQSMWSSLVTILLRTCQDDDTFRVFKINHDIPICESVSPNSSYRWHSMDDKEYQAYLNRLEAEQPSWICKRDGCKNVSNKNQRNKFHNLNLGHVKSTLSLRWKKLRICAFMDQVEAKEGKEFDYLISHHAFTNAMTAAQIVDRRHREGKTKLKHFNFVHGTALKMYIKEKEGDPEYPMRFLTKCQGSGVFGGLDSTQGVWVNSEDYIGKFLDCFPQYPKQNCVFSRIGVNQKIFRPRGTEVATQLALVIRLCHPPRWFNSCLMLETNIWNEYKYKWNNEQVV